MCRTSKRERRRNRLRPTNPRREERSSNSPLRATTRHPVAVRSEVHLPNRPDETLMTRGSAVPTRGDQLKLTVMCVDLSTLPLRLDSVRGAGCGVAVSTSNPQTLRQELEGPVGRAHPRRRPPPCIFTALQNDRFEQVSCCSHSASLSPFDGVEPRARPDTGLPPARRSTATPRRPVGRKFWSSRDRSRVTSSTATRPSHCLGIPVIRSIVAPAPLADLRAGSRSVESSWLARAATRAEDRVSS